jgi:DNA-binding response OmpR family regulator
MDKTILIVEDEKLLRDALQITFEGKGFEVITAGDGEEGLAKALKKQPDLILLDVVMPKMDGMTMLKRLRENVWGRGAKVLVLTNLSDWSENKDAVEQNVLDHLVKCDWTMKEISEKVMKKLGLPA